jgi:SAM-dependent methyltransferase
LAWESASAIRYARRQNIPGLRFDRYGRRLGARLLLRGARGGASLLLNPVSIVRYFEFEFADEVIGDQADSCVDVSSPRLLPFWLAQTRPKLQVRMINPDSADIGRSSDFIRHLGIERVDARCQGVDSLPNEPSADVVVSISVIEHIAGAYDDRQAIRWMWEAVAPGGRLVLTFPVDRKPWDEYREAPMYEADTVRNEHGVFFSRHYDLEAIHTRLLQAIGDPPHEMRFFGERTPGYFTAYAQRWMAEGLAATVRDPREIADHFQPYARWDDMPGRGVCGLVMKKGSSS